MSDLFFENAAGIEELYVHVLAENHSARKLYEQMGFVYEKEETPQTARYLGRPKRLLLRTQLVDSKR
jgi:ribosomal protein S18 acetylase RimI-like enzyme